MSGSFERETRHLGSILPCRALVTEAESGWLVGKFCPMTLRDPSISHFS